MNDCIFCKIANHDIPADIVYEDVDVIAFLDTAPVNPGHTLIIPKEHQNMFLETPDTVLEKIIVVAKKIGIAVQKSTGATGINIYINNDKDAGQVIFHTHIHIIPRFSNDNHAPWHGTPYPNDEEKQSLTEKIRKNL